MKLGVEDQAAVARWSVTLAGTFAYHITPIGEPVEDWLDDNQDRILPVASYRSDCAIAGVAIFQTLEGYLIGTVLCPLKPHRGPFPNVATESDGRLGWVDLAALFQSQIDHRAATEYEAELKALSHIERLKPETIPYLGAIDIWDGEVRNITTRSRPWEFTKLDDQSKGQR